MVRESKLVVVPIVSRNTKYVDICNAVFVSIKNQGAESVQYSTGTAKVTLLPNEEDIFPSSIHPINTKLRFYYSESNDIKIKIKQIVLI